MYDYLIENGYQIEENVVIIMRQTHEDIKLEEYIENPNDISCIKLTDFGLSIELEESTLLTEQVGTSYYMSPELYRKLPYGKKVDMWAIGIVCFALLFGKFPFEGEGKDLVANILRGKFTIPTQPNLSRDCSEIVERNNIHQCQSESLLSKLTTSNMDDVGTISEDSEN
ncbi:non-specific serine/threonine protein kinase [Entamoeba marina]